MFSLESMTKLEDLTLNKISSGVERSEKNYDPQGRIIFASVADFIVIPFIDS